MEELKTLFKDYFGTPAAKVEKLAGAGSNRTYFRLSADDGRSAIGTVGTVLEENRAFMAISAHFAAKGLNVPKVLAVSADAMIYLQEDLGSESLYAAVCEGRQSGRYSDKERRLLLDAVACLPALQFAGADGFDFSVCYPQEAFDRRNILFDLNYFKYDYLKLTPVVFDEMALQDDFERLAGDLLGCSSPWGFMYRDFQARNVMLRDGRPWFIDFQGGRRGPACYDLVSFVWQAAARYPDGLREEMTDTYISAAEPYVHIDRESFLSDVRLFALFRTLQVLGAYGFRGYIEKKAHFVQSIPFALDNAAKLLCPGLEARYPELCRVLALLNASRQEAGSEPCDGSLTVEVTSFSYRKGIPEDASGNGGGFVFDCRALENPGRYEQFRQYNGLDANVIEFLEEEGGILRYLQGVTRLVFPHIEKFIERGFSHLMVQFGCTGGQHRSVYLAEHFAQAVAERYEDVHVTVRHTNINVYKRIK